MAGLPVLGVEATGVGTQAVLVQDGEVVSRFTEGPLNVLLDPSAFDRLAHLIKESGASAAGLGLAGLHSLWGAGREQRRVDGLRRHGLSLPPVRRLRDSAHARNGLFQ